MLDPVAVLHARRVEIYERFGLRLLGVFGSQARVNVTPESDLDVLVEAATDLSPELRDSHWDVDWRRIAGLRDVLIHL